LDFRLDVLDGVIRLDVQSDGLSREGLDEDLHGTTTKTEDKVKGRLFLNVVIREGSAILELLSRENQTLLLRWNSFLVLDFRLDVLDGVIRLDVQSDGLSREGLDEDLHGTTTKTKHKVKGRLLLDVVIGKGSAVLKLFSGKDQPLLFWRDSFFVLDLRLDVLDSVIWLDIQRDRLSRESLDEDLHGTTAKSKDKMEGGFLLNVVVREGPSILELLSGKDQPLLLWRDSFFVLNLRLDILNGVVCLHVKRDCFPCKGLDKDLHSHDEIYKS